MIEKEGDLVYFVLELQLVEGVCEADDGLVLDLDQLQVRSPVLLQPRHALLNQHKCGGYPT